MDEQPGKEEIIKLLAKSHHFNLIDKVLYIYTASSYMPAYTIRNDFDFEELRKESNRLRNREENDLRTLAKILKKYV